MFFSLPARWGKINEVRRTNKWKTTSFSFSFFFFLAIWWLSGPFCAWWCFPYERLNGIFSKQYVTDTELTSQLALRWRIEQIVCDMAYGGLSLPFDDEAPDNGLPDVTLQYLREHFVQPENTGTMITMNGSSMRGYHPLLHVGSVRTKFNGSELSGFVCSKGYINPNFSANPLFYDHLVDFLSSNFDMSKLVVSHELHPASKFVA